MKVIHWKDIKGYEGLYLVSNQGGVHSVRSNKVLKFGRSGRGGCYYKVDLCNNGEKKTCLVHRLVAETFITNEGNKEQVNHIDGNKLNNCVDNLEWCTREENQQHAWETGLHVHTREVVRNNGKKNIEKFNGEKRRKVVQYSLDGTYIATFDSMRDAARSLGSISKQGNISECCSGKRGKAYGYKWKYKSGK
ncbi:UNVERIFIED_ORG: hypothetical protein Xoosp15_200 [Xanthomonas phage Xoo-sp15]